MKYRIIILSLNIKLLQFRTFILEKKNNKINLLHSSIVEPSYLIINIINISL